MARLYVIHDGDMIPFSREILSRSISIAGMDKGEAHDLAEDLMDELIDEGKKSVKDEELASLVYERLKNRSKDLAERYQFWRKFKQSKDPLIILIAGGTGTGSTSIGIELSNRLGISSISTDIIRSVLRGHIPKHLRPSLHQSSYVAWEQFDFAGGKDKVLFGFINHIEPVARSTELVVKRAIVEGFPLVVEGIHIVPGYISEDLLERPFVYMFALDLEAEEHKSRFSLREYQTKYRRPAERYLEHFKEIRQIQSFIVSQAKEEKVPIINSKNSVKAADRIIGGVTKKMMETYRFDEKT